MPRTVAPGRLPEVLLHGFAINHRINRHLVANLSAEAWRVEPPGGQGPTKAAIGAHMHGLGVMWLKVTADGRVRAFKPDAAAIVGYLVADDAHYRGPIAVLPRPHGHARKAMAGRWEWGRR